MKNIHFFPKLSVIVLTFLAGTLSITAENPPHAIVSSPPVLAGADYQFTVNLDPSSTPDCGFFSYNCNINNEGIENVDIHWFLVARTSCDGCDLDSTTVASGVVNHGFWGTNCIAGSSAPGTDCSNPGGCNSIISIPASTLCPGVEYDLMTYAMNPDYIKGLAEGSTTASGPYRCCNGNPSIGSFEAMFPCTLPANGGSGSGWLNPSYPQFFSFTLPGAPTAPSISQSGNIASGATVDCGFDWSTDIEIAPASVCIKNGFDYRVLFNGLEVGSGSSVCSDVAETVNFAAQLVGCPDDPNCSLLPGQALAQCGANTVRIEAFQNCTGAELGFAEFTFNLNCPDADVLQSDLQYVCPGESADISVQNPANVNIPYAGGSYQLHWNNPNPYAQPDLNHIGAGPDASLANDGSYPTNETITISGTIWSDFDTDIPAGCETSAQSVDIVMLEELTLQSSFQACSFNAINLAASGGLPEYDPATQYTFDATGAGAGINQTGVFTTLLDGSTPIPAGSYTVVVSDEAGCTASAQITVTDEIGLEDAVGPCNAVNAFAFDLTGGQPDDPSFGDMSVYQIESDLDGDLGSPNAAGFFSASGITAGMHNLTLTYEHLNQNGSGSGNFCSATLQAEAYDPMQITLSTDPCLFINQVGIEAVSGGRDPNNAVGGGFPSAAYSVYLSTTSNGPNNVASNEGSISGAGTLTGVTPGNYFVVLEDGRGCKTSVPVTVEDNGGLTLANVTDVCNESGTISVQVSGGIPDWTFYLYPDGDAFDGGASAISQLTGTELAPGTYEADFTGLAAANYEIYAQDSEACAVLSLPAGAFDALEIEVEENCLSGQLTATASGGHAGINAGAYDYELLDASLSVVEANTNGNFNGSHPAGVYTLQITDTHEGGTQCTESVEVEWYDEVVVEVNADICFGSSALEIANVTGGKDPAIPEFSGAAYTLVLSLNADDLTPANDGSGAPLSTNITDPANEFPYVFGDLTAGTSYYVVMTDGRTDPLTGEPCTYTEGPFTAGETPELTVAPNTCGTFNSISMGVADGQAPYDYFLYEQGQALAGAPNPPSIAYDQAAAIADAAPDLSGNPLAVTTAGATASMGNVPAGLYTLYVVDAGECSILSQEVEVYAPFDIELSENACDFVGQVEVTALAGGRDPSVTFGGGFDGAAYSLYLSTVPAPTGSNNVPNNEGVLTGPGTFTGVADGNYHVILEDGRGCKFSVPVTVGGNASLTATAPDCDTPGGGVQVTAGGGTPDWDFYVYETTGTFDPGNPEGGSGWVATDPGNGTGNDASGNFEGLPAGNYHVYALDNNGCEADFVEVTAYAALNLGAEADLCGFGELEVTAASGGNDPAVFAGAGAYTIFISTTAAPGATNNVANDQGTLDGPGTFSGIAQGSYFAVIEDDRGCQFSVAFEVVAPLELEQLAGNCEAGSVSVGATGGLADWSFYLYQPSSAFDPANPEGGTGWLASDPADGSGSDTEGSFAGLSSGDYLVYGLDANGCPSTGLEVSVGDALNLENVAEACDYGIIDLEAEGGETPYIFTLFNGATGVQIEVNNYGLFDFLAVGTYDVRVTDALGCTAALEDVVITTTTIQLEQPYDCAQGFVVSGGTGTDYWYQIYTPAITPVLVDENGTGAFPSLDAGNYVLLVTDEANCSRSFFINCDDNPECDLSASVDSTECADVDGFNLTISITGSSSYTISDGINPDLGGLAAGLHTIGPIPNGAYSISITDEANDLCTETLTGEFDCFDCALEATAGTECLSDSLYSITLEIGGNGTFTVDDGIHDAFEGVAAGSFTIDSMANGDYEITITSEIDTTCTLTLNGAENCVCDLNLSYTTECVDIERFDASIEIGGSGIYTLIGAGDTLAGLAAGSYTIDSLANGEHEFYAFAENDSSCNQTLTVSGDCFDCELAVSAVAECVDGESFNALISIDGNGSFSIAYGSALLTGQGAGTSTIGPLPLGAYEFTVTSEADTSCHQTLVLEQTNCTECVLDVTAQTVCNANGSFDLILNINEEGTFQINVGNTTLVNQPGGENTYGGLSLGAYNLTITSEADTSCTAEISVDEDCVCDLTATATPECVDGLTYSLTVDIGGDGTFDIDDGVNPPLTGLPAGSHTIGPFGNGAYSITVTDNSQLSCSESLSGEFDCFECDLQATAALTCVDAFNFVPTINLSGTGTYSIDDGTNPVLTGQTAGFVALGQLPNGDYEITIRSEEDSSCLQTISGTQDCFQCNLVATLQTECVDQFNFSADLILTGNGTYTINDGVHPPLTGQAAGLIELGTFENGSHEIEIINENDPSCTETLSAEEDCFECDLQISATPECAGNDGYDLALTISGSGTYTIDDGVNPVQTGIAAGTYVGNYANGGYSLTVTSEEDPNCTETVSGSLDCFECDLAATGVTECAGIDSFTVQVTIAGSGSYTLSDGINVPLSGLQAGEVTVGPFANGGYSISITDENHADCSAEVSGSGDCFECGLEVNATPDCVNLDGYILNIDISGNGTFSLSDGINPALVQLPAGSYVTGPYASGGYAIEVVSETEPTCVETVTGSEDCFVCDLGVNVSPECAGIDGYNLIIDISGSGTFSVSDGINQPLANQQAGTLILGPYPNGGYAISVVSEIDSSCAETVSGEEDCFECQLDASATTECNGGLDFNVVLDLQGNGTYTIQNGIEPPISGVVAGSYTYGPYPNGVYTIGIVSELDPTCVQTLTGSQDCFVCDLSANLVAECADFNNFGITLTLEGTGTYTVFANGLQQATGLGSGSHDFGPFPTGGYNVTVVSEVSASCQQTLASNWLCFECDLPTFATTNCLDDDSYEVIFTLEGTGTYTINDGTNPVQTGVNPGTYTAGPIPNGSYEIVITSEEDPLCIGFLSGENDCTPIIPCDPNLGVQTVCTSDSTYNLSVTFSGTGTYLLDDGINEPISVSQAGSYTLGPIPNGDYSLTLTNANDPDCVESVSGTFDCTPEFECEFNVFGETACLNEDSYNVILNLTGEGLYTITPSMGGAFIDPLTGQAAGTITVGPFLNGPYSIVVTNEADADCSTTLGGIEDCTIVIPCDLELSATTECETDSSYSLNLLLGGTGLYDISVTSENTVFSTVASAGVLNLSGVANGIYQATASSQTDSSCTLSISGVKDCTPEFECDPQVVADAVCLSPSSYELQISLGGTGVYTLSDGINPPISGATAGEYVLGPIPNGSYTITASSETEPDCVLTVSGESECDFDCELEVSSFISCVDESSNSFEVLLTISGSSTYTVVDGVNPPIAGVLAGDLTLGPYPSGSYNVTVTNEDAAFCFQTVSGNKECSQPNECDMNLNLTTECNDANILVLTLTIEGNSTYTVFVFPPFGPTFNDVAPGTYTFEAPFFLDVYNFTVRDESNPDCQENITGGNSCDGCDLETEVEFVCTDNGFHQLVVTVNGSGVYDIDINDGFESGFFDNVTDGVYILDDLTGEFYDVNVQDVDNNDCFQDFTGFNECPLVCDLSIALQTHCLPDVDGLFEVIMEIDGSGTYTIEDGVFGPFANLTAGTHSLGPYPSGEYLFNVFDDTGLLLDCFASSFISRDCNEDCDLSIAYETVCVNDAFFEVHLTIEGSSVYSIDDGFGTALDNQPPGEYVLGPYFEDAFFAMVVIDENNSSCFQNFFSNSECGEVGGPCDLSASIGIECSPDAESFTIALNVSGSDFYTVTDGINPPMTDVGAGTLTMGPYNNGSYSISIANQSDAGCNQTFSGSNFCELPPECDLSVDAGTVCNGDNTGYGVALSISGSSTYNVYSNDELIASGISAIDLTVDGFQNNQVYDILVLDPANPLCVQTISGTYSCFEPVLCDLEASVEVNCIDAQTSEFEYIVTVEGTGVYNIEVAGFGLLENVQAGEYLFDDIPPTDEYQIFIHDVNLGDLCSVILSGGVDCEPPTGGCTIPVVPHVECVNNGHYQITFDIQGGGTYSIYEGLYVNYPFTTDLVESGVSGGSITVGPIDNGTSRYLILDENNEQCFSDFVFWRNCFSNNCDLNFGAEAVCTGVDEFMVLINLEGSSTYQVRVYDAVGGNILGIFPGQTAGEMEVGPFEGNEYYIFVQDEDEGPCDQDYRGSAFCKPITDCDLVVDYDFQCNAAGEPFWTFNVSGTGFYSLYGIDENGGSDLLINNEHPDNIDNASGYTSVQIINENIPDCSITLTESNCNDDCDLDINTQVTCLADGNFMLDIQVEASINYSIGVWDATSPGTSAALLNEGNTNEESYTVGPFDSDNYYLEAFYLADFDCFVSQSGSNSCTPVEPSCDLSVSYDVDCVNEGEQFMVTLNINGTQTYTLETDLTDPLTGQTAGELVLGPFDSQNNPFFFNIRVESEQSPNCFANIAAQVDCIPPFVCNLQADANVLCQNGDSYILELTIAGSGTFDVIGNFGSQPNVPAGTYEIGPLVLNNFEFTVVSNLDESCFQTINGTENCEDPDPECELSIAVASNCLNDVQYEVALTISGGGLYRVTDGINPPVSNLAAGSHTFGPYQNGSYSLTVISQSDPNCSETAAGVKNCLEVTPCNLAAFANPVCINDGSYNVLVSIIGNAQYQLTDQNGNQLDNQTEGEIVMGPYDNGFYEIEIVDQSNPDCFQTLQGVTDCSNPFICDIDGLEVEAVCQTDSTFFVNLFFAGPSVYSITYASGETLTGQLQGEHILGPYPNGNYSIAILDETNPDCFQTVSGAQDCTPPPVCDLAATADAVCLDTDSYEIQLQLTGSGSYTITDGINDPLTGVPAGAVNLGPYQNGSYNLLVEDETTGNCGLSLAGSRNCFVEPPCDLAITTATQCVTDSTYSVILTLLGNAAYTVEDGTNTPMTDVLEGVYELGPYQNGSYAISVFSQSDPTCSETANGIRDCSSPLPCNLSAFANTLCINDSSYSVILSLSGNSIYGISDQTGTLLANQPEGEIVLGPFENGAYEISITDQSKEGCGQVLTGTADCTNPVECDIANVGVNAICQGESGFLLELSFSGGGSYTIADGINAPQTGLASGEHVLGLFPNGSYSIAITDEANPDCSQSIAGSQDCSLPPACDLSAVADAICADDGSFFIDLTLSGSGSYTIADGVNTPMTGEAAGPILVGPLPGGSYSVSITDEANPDCAITLNGSQSCELLLASLTDLVFNDLDNDGILDDGEPGLPGIQVTLYHSNGDVFGQTFTDEGGYYTFDDVPPGSYFISVGIPTGYEASPKDEGTDEGLDSDINPSGQTDVFTLAEGENKNDIGAGMFIPVVDECTGFSAQTSVLCDELTGEFDLVVTVSGGMPPYEIDAGDLFSLTANAGDFPLDHFGPYPNGTSYVVGVSDANGCVVPFMGGVPECNTVGVELLHFAGEVLPEGNLLKWATAAEINNDYFTLTRSVDGNTFDPIATVDGAGNSTSTLHYDWLDTSAPDGLSYYQLQQTDFDGTTTPSNIVSLNRAKAASFEIVSVSPVPTRGIVQLGIALPDADKLQATLYDIAGKKLDVFTIQAHAGLNTLQLDLSGYAAGTYLLSVASKFGVESAKLVKE